MMTTLLGSAFLLSLLGVVACGDDPGSDDAGSDGEANAGGNGVVGSGSGGTATGGGTGGSSTGGTPGSGGEAVTGAPYVFVGTTDGFVRVYAMDEVDGALSDASAFDTGEWLDFFTVGPDNRTVFVSSGGNVSAFAYDPAKKTLTLIDSASTFGAGTHVEVDPTGGFVFVAHYNEGKLTFLP
ncbi:MAG TPA: beta-propeller fold lactonase family protein, partial [Polyangiaceae bacterium]|nr:beta-propeller fold lactonase family protein [Polyangiaceae bacterium]